MGFSVGHHVFTSTSGRHESDDQDWMTYICIFGLHIISDCAGAPTD